MTRSTKAVIVGLLIHSTALANVCTDLATGLWSAPATWQSCGGTTPQPADSVQIINGHAVTGDTNWTVTSILISGSGSKLLRDSSARTIATTASGSATNIQVNNLGQLDWATNASVGNELTYTCGGSTGSCIVTQFVTPFTAAVVIKVDRMIFSSSGSQPFFIGDDNHTGTFQISHVIANGAISHFFQAFGPINGILDSNSWSGVTGGDAISFGSSPATGWTITNNTDTSTASSGAIFRVINTMDGMTFTANAAYSSSTSTERTLFDPIFSVLTTAAVTGSYNIGKSIKTVPVTAGLNGCLGAASFHCVFHHNVLEGYIQGVVNQNYTDSSFNWCSGNTNTVVGQGCYFRQTDGGNWVSTSDIGTTDPGSTGNNIIFFACCSGSAQAQNITFDHAGAFNIPPLGVSAWTIMIGESGPTFGQGNVQVSNSIALNGDRAITSESALNTFVGTGTGGVGVYNNNTFGATTAYTRTVGDTNFGVSPAHPSSTYGDSTVNPGIYRKERRLADCDAILGGPGTADHLFAQLALRWNGTNGIYTAQNIQNCMVRGMSTQNVVLATQGVGGTFVGPYKPIGLIGSFIP